MQLICNRQDLIFYLQSKKINISGVIEKEELANMIVNHVNSNSYYETTETSSNTSTTPNNDFENYAQSFDQIKTKVNQTCQNLFSSISDKISSGNKNYHDVASNKSLRRHPNPLHRL